MGKAIFLIAAIITTLIFLLVFSFVQYDESSKYDALSKQIMALYEEQQANKILQNYLGKADENSCIIYERQISRQLNRIYGLFSELEKLKTSTFATSSDEIKRQYLLASMSLWIDLKNASETCALTLKPVLYFFPDRQDCIECDAMINLLETVKSQCPNVRVFAFPSESQDFEFVELLKKDYNVSSAPAIVIGNNATNKILPVETIKSWLDCK
jgi:hypothetical protein